MTSEKEQQPLMAGHLPTYHEAASQSNATELIIGLDHARTQRRRQASIKALLLLVVTVLAGGGLLYHFQPSDSSSHLSHGGGENRGPFPWFPPPPHRPGHGPPPPPPGGPPHHQPLQCWPLPAGEEVNISLPLAAPHPPPPHPPLHRGAHAWRWLGGLLRRHRHGPPPPPPRGPTIYLHTSLLSSEVKVVRDEMGRHEPSAPLHLGNVDEHEREHEREHGHAPAPPRHPFTIMGTFTRQAAKKEHKSAGGDGDDGEERKPRNLDICTFPAPHGGVTVGIFRPPPKHHRDHLSPPPPPSHGEQRPFPPFPREQYKEISAVLHLPAGAPLEIGTVPPPPPPPGHGHRDGASVKGRKKGCGCAGCAAGRRG
ncbi:hypothetical protein BDZ90DRAFT_230706 [Jaminaea rosea]|uniref:Uncharacterized protein n=1 Tax=Jaminaea rosea TaxID=1569628 RepID=A0A316UX32_9BASI|nr:hypothetical protein BDZ90DRAFT_230706 [Jaminaea rosea]PWN29870.1 hypothetical protein BDZ90DRAFT_230706 [Jaminaea rosea]